MKSSLLRIFVIGLISSCVAIASAASELLFSQFSDNQSTFGPSQQWSPAINSEIADDFEVMGDIDRVRASGFIWGTVSFEGVYVRFYEFGADNMPGALQREYFLETGLNWSDGSIEVALSPPFKAKGKHFLSVQPIGNYWYWWSSSLGAPRSQAFFFRDNVAGESWHHGDNLNLDGNADVTFFLFGSVTKPGEITGLSADMLARSEFLEIFGSNLGGSGTVLIGGVVSPVAHWSSTRIAAYVPEGAPLGPVDVQVINAGGRSNVKPVVVTLRERQERVNWRLRMEGAYSRVRPAMGPDGTIYAVDVGFRLYAVGPDGSLKWTVRGAGNKGVAVGADGTIYTASEDAIQAFAPSGERKWTFVQDPRAFICLGVIVGPDGNIYSVGTHGLGVFSLTPEGMLRWTNPEPYDRPIVDYAEIVIGPNDGRDQLYFSANNHTRAVRLEGGVSIFTIGRTGQPVVSPFDGTMHSSAAAYRPDGRMLWRFSFPMSGFPISVPDVALDGTHYMTHRLSELYAVNPDGSEKWRLGMSDYIGPPNVDPGNSVVVVGSGGTLDSQGFVAGISASSSEELWRVKLPVEEAAVFNPWTGQFGFNQFVDTRAKFSADGSAVYLVTAIATGNLVRDRCFLYSIDTSWSKAPPGPIALRCANISLRATTPKNGAVSVNGDVFVAGQDGVAEAGADVTVVWTLPGGRNEKQKVITSPKGHAEFTTRGRGGAYKLTVVNIAKTGRVFDRSGSTLSAVMNTGSRRPRSAEK